MAEPLLDITTLIKRETIAVDGQRYELLSVDELSVLDSQRFQRWIEQLTVLQEGTAGDDADRDAIDGIVDAISRKALVDMPADVFAKLSGAHKIRVAEVFIGLLLAARMATAGAIQKATGHLPTGANSFPGFSGSTAAARATGWRARLLRWLGLT